MKSGKKIGCKLKRHSGVLHLRIFSKSGYPFSIIKAKENEEVHFALEVVKRNGSLIPVGETASIVEKIIERCPLRGQVTLTVPSVDFEKLMWY